MEVVSVLLDQLFGWVGLGMALCVAGYLWLRRSMEAAAPDYVRKVEARMAEHEAQRKAKEELLRSIRMGEYGDALQSSVGEIEKELMRGGGKQRVSYEQALYLAKKYGSRMSVNEEGEFVLRSEAVAADEEKEAIRSPKGWRQKSLESIPAVSAPENPSAPVVSLASETVRSESAATMMASEASDADEVAAAERSVKEKLMGEPWFRHCGYFNGECDGAGWKIHPTFPMARYKERDEGGIEIATPYARSVIENNRILSFTTWESLLEEPDEYGSSRRDKSKAHKKPLPRVEMATHIIPPPQEKENGNGVQQPKAIRETVALKVKSSREFVEMLERDSMTPQGRDLLLDPLTDLFCALASEEAGRFLYANNGVTRLALSADIVVSLMAMGIQEEERTEFFESFRVNGELSNDLLTDALDGLNRFFAMAHGYDPVNPDHWVFSIGVSSLTYKLFGIRPLVLKVRSNAGESVVHIHKGIVANGGLLRKFYRFRDFAKGMNVLASIEVYSPAETVAFGTKQVEKYLKLNQPSGLVEY